uniref:Arrestin domain containing 4 n=1 Tax=Chrysemys picta bellii TaxID=8478 RepID=A0A8C3I302_CHRPI
MTYRLCKLLSSNNARKLHIYLQELFLFLEEAIPIYAEIENCSSRLIVPKAAIFQTQTYLASGKTKTFRQMLANVRGNPIASGSTDTWNGKTLKIPPVTPSILNCCIIRVEYSLAVYIHIPGANKLMIELPLVIGTIPYTGFSSRNSSAGQFSVDMSWLALTMPEHPEGMYFELIWIHDIYNRSRDCCASLKLQFL